MKNKNLIIYIVICLIIIAGVAVWEVKGFRTELQYAPRKQIQLSNHAGFEISEIESIASEVLGDTEFIVQPVETFGNSASIVARDITEEQRDEIVEKFKDKYDAELEKDDVEIVSIPFTRIKDVIKHFIVPGIATLVIVATYFAIRFKKLGLRKVLLKTILAPVVAEILMFSLISIARIPFSRLAVAIGIGLYGIVIISLTVMFENQRNKYLEELEKDN